MSSDIRSYVSRYVVPFYFDSKHGGYEKLKQHFLSNTPDDPALGLPKDGRWMDVCFWKNYKSAKDTLAEMDIYSYLQSLFREEENEDGKAVSNLGISLVCNTNGKLFELEYKYGEKHIGFDCKDLGILLLRNGIGFIWYETEFKKKISIDEYVGFQHDFKELARPHSEKFVKKIGYDKEKREGIYAPFCLGKWLSDVIGANALKIRFWAEREIKSSEGSNVSVPDKALLFQYLFIEQAKDPKRDNLVFQIANGYDGKYNAPDDITKSLYKPFGNTCFYVSKAGMACIATNIDSNEAFFDDQFRGKYVRDYFFIYILLIYQSYSCAHYSRLLTKLPAETDLFDKHAKYMKELEALNEQIQLFLVKSVFESVSNIHHQNGVYRYGEDVLCVKEDIQSLMIGLNALEEMEKDKRKEAEEKRGRRVNRILMTIGFMAVVSAWIDALNLVDWIIERAIVEKCSNVNFLHFVVTLVLIVVLVFAWRYKDKDVV